MQDSMLEGIVAEALAGVSLEKRTRGVDVAAILAKRTQRQRIADSRVLFTLRLSLLFGSGFWGFAIIMVCLKLFAQAWVDSHAALFLGIALPLGFLAACSGFAGALCWCDLPRSVDWDRALALKYMRAKIAKQEARHAATSDPAKGHDGGSVGGARPPLR